MRTIKVRTNQNTTAKCRCGLVFARVAVIYTAGKPTRYLPYFCGKCDSPPK